MLVMNQHLHGMDFMDQSCCGFYSHNLNDEQTSVTGFQQADFGVDWNGCGDLDPAEQITNTSLAVGSPNLADHELLVGVESGLQTDCTLRWLNSSFCSDPDRSISRTIIYEMYQKFCQQNSFNPVCKASFGKLVKRQFSQVKSKRLGARGQSKYHYCHIALRGNVKLSFHKNEQPDFRISSRSSNHREDQDCGWSDSVRHQSLTPLSNKESRSILNNWNENDTHSIIQSMLSFMKLPPDQPLHNPKLIFLNLYKTHCQCLIDAALSGNFVQMRHYLMHFWQQLPDNVKIYVDLMQKLNSYMYSLLNNVYLSLNSSPENLIRINTMGHLMPQILWNIFKDVPDQWSLEFSQYHTNSQPCRPTQASILGRIKFEETLRWQYRIQFIVNLITTIKKLDLSILPESLDILYIDFQRSRKNPNLQILVHPRGGSFSSESNLILELLLEALTNLIQHLKTTTPCSHQVIIDQLDLMIRTIVDRNNQCQRTTGRQQLGLYQTIALMFNHLRVSMIADSINHDLIDSYDDDWKNGNGATSWESWSDIDDDDDEEEEKEQHSYDQLEAQKYLLMMVINDYLMLICQTIKQDSIII